MRWSAAVTAAVALTLSAAAHANAAVPPANDAFAAAATLAGEQGRSRGSNAGATKEAGEPAHAGNVGGASVWFRWTAPRSGQFAFATEASDFDTVLAVYTGPALAALAAVAADDDSGPEVTSEVSFRAVAGTVYQVAIDGFQGKVGRVDLAWGPAPQNDNFAAARAIEGRAGRTSSAGVGATAEAGEPAHRTSGADRSIWFRWTAPADMEAGFLAPGAAAVAVYTGASLDRLVPVARGSKAVFRARAATTYHIAVDGAARQAILVWQGPPPNDDFARATRISGESGRARGLTVVASRQRGEPGHGDGASASVWYRWRAPRDGILRLRTAGSSFDTLLAVYRGSGLRTLRRLAANDDSADSVTSSVRIAVERGKVYRIAVDGFDGETGEVVLRWTLSPASRGRR